MVLEFKLGRTEQNMKANGNKIKPVGRANSGMLMVMNTPETGRTTRRMDTEFMCT